MLKFPIINSTENVEPTSLSIQCAISDRACHTFGCHTFDAVSSATCTLSLGLRVLNIYKRESTCILIFCLPTIRLLSPPKNAMLLKQNVDFQGFENEEFTLNDFKIFKAE